MTDHNVYRSIGFAAVVILAGATAAFPQPRPTSGLRGTVTDQTGAALSGAWVTIESTTVQKRYATTNREGRYGFERVLPGRYTVIVSRSGFMEFKSNVELRPDTASSLDVQLKVAIAVSVNVRDPEGLSAAARKNLSGLILTSKDLKGLPDDPRLLLNKILEMAGSTGRPGDVAVYVNGFREYRRLPHKDIIEIVRVNSNLFSAEFSQAGAQRIEIVTKPGGDALHGDIGFQSRATPFESRDPITGTKPHTRYSNYKGYLQGPIAKGRVGFVVSAGYWQQDDNAFVHATVLSPATLNSEGLRTAIPTPTAVESLSAQLDVKWRSELINMSYTKTSEQNRNLGLLSGFDLEEHGYDRTANDEVGRLWWTTVSGQAVNDLRFEVSRGFATTTPLATTPAVLVLDAFNAGGNQTAGTQRSTTGIQAAETLSVQRGRHTVKAGVQLEITRQNSIDRSGFGGTYTFGTDVERDGFGTPIGNAGEQIPISPLERYRRTVLRLPGYGPSQFLVVRGDPLVAIAQRHISWFALDDWSPSRRMTLSYGVRQELQNDVAARMNLAPRAALSWLLDAAGKSAIKLGGGVFFRRVDPDVSFDITRLDGVKRQQLTIEQPSFFTTQPVSIDATAPGQSTTYAKSDDLRNPLSLVATISYERQLPGDLFGVAQYLINKGSNQLRLRNVTAPVPGTAGPLPDPVLHFESTGRSLQQQLMLGLRQNVEDISLYANYTFGAKRSDTDGPYSLPANSHDLASEYGWASDDQRHLLVAGGTVDLTEDLVIALQLVITSGRPFNITTGLDNNSDTRFTDRPSFAAPGAPGAIETWFGTFDPHPPPGAAVIPRNLGREPWQMNVDVSATKALTKGLMMTLDVQNILNQRRLYGSTGVLTSDLFGKPNLALNGRRLWLTFRYGF